MAGRHCVGSTSIVLLAFLLRAPLASAQANSSAQSDSTCFACHGQAGFKSDAGRLLYVDPSKHQSSVHAGLNCTACHSDVSDFPHLKRPKKISCAVCHSEEAAATASGIHSALGEQACTACHGSAHYVREAATIDPETCGSCHAQELDDLLASVHGAARKRGDVQSPSCHSCHGDAHHVLAVRDPKSTAAKKNQPATCGACHSDAGFAAKHQIPFAHPVESYLASVHGHAVVAGKEAAASCADCHSPHAIKPASDRRSTINRWNVPRTCGACHTEIEKAYEASVHGQAVAHGATDAPVCTDCHGDHTILAPTDQESLVNPLRVSLVTCGRCHGDARLDARYNLPADRVPTFADSFHGLANHAGSQTVANCASCHGVHNIFPSTDPRSMVNQANLAHTCGACHSGAGSAFAIGQVHVSAEGKESAAVRWIRRIYWILIPITLGFMLGHHFLDFRKKFRSAARAKSAERSLERMNLHFRVAHWLTVVSFPVLVVTGFALKFPDAWWARPMLVWEGHFALRGTVHRLAAALLLASLAYHAVHLALVRRDRAKWHEMVPRWKDLQDLGHTLLYNLGWSEARPTFGRFSYVEKIEYLAFLWGTLIMAATGFLLWFNSFTLRHFPKWVADAATALHFYEAILATGAIAIWHMYTVVFDPDVYPMDRTWLDGRVSAEHLRAKRPGYYDEIGGEPPVDSQDPKAAGRH